MDQDNKEPLLESFQLGDLTLKNRIVMASLTRSRADNPESAPTDLNVLYYQQRASAGLILTESTWVSKNAIGFINLPGIYSEAQVAGWKKVTEAVHEKGGKIFIQIAHSGAVSHPDFFDGELPLGPSTINPQEKTFTPKGFKDTVTPKAYTVPEIKATIEEYKKAAANAKLAGFDGVEIHAQIFTLIPQFLHPATNQRIDEYGGTIQNRARIIFEIIDAVKTVYPDQRIGIKFTPAAYNMGLIKPIDSTLDTFTYIFKKLNDLNLAYIHLVGPDVDLTGTPLNDIATNYYGYFRKLYNGRIMVNRGFNKQSANEIIKNGDADLVSFGTYYIANPDLVERFAADIELAEADSSTFYTSGEKGYTDYPTANEVISNADNKV
ncbi:MAG: alkene reductase [Mucilaginibacter sp.]|uniref:alkene reductase n=1 Tax=Mucilaginibacter sp. TaxID=1882438 RepID=UPI0031AC5B60